MVGLKAQKHLAQGNALGNVIAINRPERAKALFTAAIMLLPFQGVLLPMHTNPGCRFALPWAMCFCPFRAYCFLCIQNPGCRFALPWAMCFCPFRAYYFLCIQNPGCRFALPWAMCSLPFQGVSFKCTILLMASPVTRSSKVTRVTPVTPRRISARRSWDPRDNSGRHCRWS